jgi:GMP synthase (glutamine-hydrolysing)
MPPTQILILDYSLTRVEAPAISRWLPADAQVSTLYIGTGETFPDDLEKRSFTHVVHSGSALSILETAPFTQKVTGLIQAWRDSGVAQFGICYGHQLVCLALIGEHAIRSSPNGLEVGWGDVTFNSRARSALGVGETEAVWQSHFDEVIELPEGSELWATSTHTEIQAYVNYEQRLLGTQFHPEFDKQAGDRLFLDDREMLESHGLRLEEILSRGPTIDAGEVFFGHFVDRV